MTVVILLLEANRDGKDIEESQRKRKGYKGKGHRVEEKGKQNAKDRIQGKTITDQATATETNAKGDEKELPKERLATLVLQMPSNSAFCPRLQGTNWLRAIVGGGCSVDHLQLVQSWLLCSIQLRCFPLLCCNLACS